ncbi:hypothetical protein Tco_0269753 [Tanacetum coccineum]
MSSSTVTYTFVYIDSELGRVFWGASEELPDGGPPRVIVMAAPTVPVYAKENLGDPIDIRVDIIHLEPVNAVPFPAATRANKAETEGITLRVRVRSLELIETWLHGIVRDEREAREKMERQLGLIQEELESLRRSRLP